MCTSVSVSFRVLWCCGAFLSSVQTDTQALEPLVSRVTLSSVDNKDKGKTFSANNKDLAASNRGANQDKQVSRKTT